MGDIDSNQLQKDFIRALGLKAGESDPEILRSKLIEEVLKRPIYNYAPNSGISHPRNSSSLGSVHTLNPKLSSLKPSQRQTFY